MAVLPPSIPALELATLSLTRRLETPRGTIKKLRFAPGKGNSKLFVLYSNRLDIRDTQSVSYYRHKSIF